MLESQKKIRRETKNLSLDISTKDQHKLSMKVLVLD